MKKKEVQNSHFEAAWINLDSNIHTVRSLAQQSNEKLKTQSHDLH